MASLKVDDELMLKQAIDEARARLGGTNWELVRLIEREIIEYRLG
jgi:hypothetical protein